MASHTVLPHSRAGSVGVALAALAVLAVVALIATDTGGPTAWLAVWVPAVIGGVAAIVAIARNGERALLGYVALVPLALFVVLLVMEITGLME